MTGSQDDAQSWYSGHVSGFTSSPETQSEPPQSSGMLNRFLYDTTQVQDRLIQGYCPTDQQRRRDVQRRLEKHLRLLREGDADRKQ